MVKILLIYSFVFVLATLVHARGDIVQGCINCKGDYLIYHEVLKKNALPFIKRSQEVTVHAVMVDTARNQVIKGISIVDVKGDGESYIKRGGVGREEVTFKIKGQRGRDYHFIVDVYAG